ncbi:MAG: TIGR04053 family radical SAM/SPASM domain-containing protein [Nitrososphaerales archaeon]
MFDQRPLLVFWESTKACLLSCKHCRAEAITNPLPDELSSDDAKLLIEQVRDFGKPYPIMIFTGGDLLMRRDIFGLIKFARDLGIKVSVSPSVTPLLNRESLKKFRDLEVSSISISLDSSDPNIHDEIRGVSGTFERSLKIIKQALSMGLDLQVNTVVMKKNLRDLPFIYKLIRNLGIDVWEIFFLIKTGRALEEQDLTKEEYEAVCNFLYDISCTKTVIRCIEAPFIRRIAKLRSDKAYEFKNELYRALTSSLYKEYKYESTISLKPILDGDGIIFVSYNGNIFPGGFLPLYLGNIKEISLVDVYKNHKILVNIRNRNLKGYCGICEYKKICGGSRARAYSYYNDPLERDPACILNSEENS